MTVYPGWTLFCLFFAAAFLIGGYNGSFFGASTDWNYAGDWANLLDWPWSNRTIGAPLTPPHMEDEKGCGWDRQFEGANVTINFCTSHQYARIDWVGSLFSGVDAPRPDPCTSGAAHCDERAASRPLPAGISIVAAGPHDSCAAGASVITVGARRRLTCVAISRGRGSD